MITHNHRQPNPQQSRTSLYEAGGGLAAAGAPGGASSLSNVSVIHHGGKLLSLGDVGLPYEISPADLSRRRRHLGVLRVPGGALAQDPLQQPKRTTHLNASTAGVSLVMGRATNGAPQDPPLHESPRAVPKRALTRERERERQFP